MHRLTSIGARRRGRRCRPAPIPSLAEIRERAAQVREGWDPETFDKRLVGHDAERGHYTIPVVRTPVEFDSVGDRG